MADFDAKFDALQQTLSQLCNQLGIHPIAAESSQQAPPVMESFIEFPIFDGVSGDLRPWILWMEDFFVRENFTEDEKLNLAQSLLEGKAYAWFSESQETSIFPSWKHLKNYLFLLFGDFRDPELLISQNDRLLQEQRVEKPRKRMETTSLNPRESISSPATIPETITVDKFSNPQVDEISAEKKESKQEVDLSMEKIASQLKLPNTTVHVSDSENLRNIETRIENSVLDNFDSVVKESKIHKNVRMDVVNGDVERIQRVLSVTKNVSAHQVLDKTSAHKERLKPQSKRKLSLSLKTWKFKFKNKMLQRNRSHMDLHQVIDISKVTNSYPCFSVSFGLVRKKRTIQCLQLKKQAHNSRFLYQLRMLHDPGGKNDEHSDDIFETEVDRDNVQRAQMDIVAESVITAPDNVAPSTDVIPNRQKWNAACDVAIDALDGPATWIVVSLPANNIEEAVEIAQVTLLLQLFLDDYYTHMRHRWESKLRLHSGFDGEKLTELDIHLNKNQGLLVFPWNLMLLGFFLFIHLEDKVCLSGASNSWCGWRVFDRGKNKIISGDVITLVLWDLKKCFFHGAEKRDVQTMLLVKAKNAHVDSLIVRIKVIMSCGVALGKRIQWAEIQKLSWYKELWIKIMDGDIAKLLNSAGGKLQSYGFVLRVTFLHRLRVHQQQKKGRSTKSWRFKYKSRLQEINLTDTRFLCEKVHRASCLLQA